MTTASVTITQVQHDWKTVLGRLAREGELRVISGGQTVARLAPPAPDEPQMDAWATTGAAPLDWREQQHGLRRWLASAPARDAEASGRDGTAAILADRDESDR